MTLLFNPGNYKIHDKLYEGAKALVYRGERVSDRKPVIIKLVKRATPALKYEFEMIKDLHHDGIVRPLSLEGNQALILEDFGGIALKTCLKEGALEIGLFLSIALQLVDALNYIHQRSIIHKDLNPANMIFNPQTEQIKITDFSIASVLSRENPRINSVLEGTLTYISPEQTGRMNRSLDYRTDFYSLGISFYEMLVGRVPFDIRDSMEVIHAHMARMPVPPAVANRNVPQALSDIVMKLIAKTAEERYQSAYGLKMDLEECERQWNANRRITPFILGMRDLPSHFHISQKLYGREAEIQQLLQAFDRVCDGAAELVLVSGYSGIGKSSLVNETHKPITEQRGYFIAGKFDQFKRNIPYTALIQAFQELIRQLLTETSDEIDEWHEKLMSALGTNGQVIIDVIPEVELIIGTQPSLIELGATEAQNRFEMVFRQFISVFTQQEHPLVIFLDDLQWSDIASLKLMEMVLSANSRYLLLIGSYRDNEVHSGHPLNMTLGRIADAGTTVTHMNLQPLNVGYITELIADTFFTTLTHAHEFAELVHEKTGGNPFFLTQLLKSLYADGLIRFDFERGTWDWDIEKIRQLDITDNVVDLMIGWLQPLPENTRAALQLAACIGSHFDLHMLAIVHQKTPRETSDDLWHMLQLGLVVPLNDLYKLPRVAESAENVEYRFLHDRVQQAAYALIPEAERAEVHLKVGMLLLDNTPTHQLDDKLFHIVNHLNIGRDLWNSPRERLLDLNMAAARKARLSTAYDAALRYIHVALSLLSLDSWEREYDKTLLLYTEALEIEYLNTNYDRLEVLADHLLVNAHALLDKVRVYQIQIQYLISQNRMHESLDVILHVLKMMDIELVEEPQPQLLAIGFNVESLAELPRMTDPVKEAAMRILMLAAPPTYLAKPSMFPSIGYTMVDLCLKYGNSALCPYAYAVFGLTLGGALNLIDTGYRFGKLAFKLLDVVDAREIKAQIHEIFDGHMRHWKEPLHLSPPSQIEGIQAGLAMGQVEYTAYLASFYFSVLFFTGENLKSVAEKYEHQLSLLERLKMPYQYHYAVIWEQLAKNLRGDSDHPIILIGERFHENRMLPDLIERSSLAPVASYYLAKTMLFYLYGEYEQCIEHARLARQYENGIMGTVNIPRRKFYHALALLALIPSLPDTEKITSYRYIDELRLRLAHWSHHAPVNFEHLCELVEAEKARVEGRAIDAMRHYDSAIQKAQQNQYIQDEALANELAGRFFYQLGRYKVAQVYIQEACNAYFNWGALAKVRHLQKLYPDWLFVLPDSSPFDTHETTRQLTGETIFTSIGTLDVMALVRALQSISEEINLERLLEKLMKVVLQNAGAQKGVVVLEQNGELFVEAEYDSELKLMRSLALEKSAALSPAIARYVANTQQELVLHDAENEGMFTQDVYVKQNKPRSVLCTPIQRQGKLIGVLYLENNLTVGAFTPERLKVLELLTSQIGISIENARLYENSNLLRIEAERANELKLRFLGMVSHELRTPLTSIKGFTTTLLAPDVEWSADDQRMFLSIIETETEKLRNMVEQLLDVSRMQAAHLTIEMQNVFIADILEAARSQIQMLTRDHRMVFDIEPDLPPVIADKERIAQVITNLINNAVKYSPPRTTITLRIDRTHNYLRVRVCDEGEGIPQEERARVFEAFQQAERKAGLRKGAGLGLAICKGLVEAHSGQIWIEDQSPPGTTLVFTLPFAEIDA